MSRTSPIGKPISRVDGMAKVTGAARYAGEFNVPGLLHGYVVNSAITKGRITKIHADELTAVPGIVAILSHENRPDLPADDEHYQDITAPGGSPFRPFYDEQIRFSAQPVALVVAETFELARYAAARLRIDYQIEDYQTDLEKAVDTAYQAPATTNGFFEPPPSRGDFDAAWAQSAHQLEGHYTHKTQHHNPMELCATTVEWLGDRKLTIYDKTQGTFNNQQYVQRVFGLSKEEARIITQYTGGAFGLGLRPQYHLFLAVMAALQLQRSVRVTLTRQQMYSLSYRPLALQTVKVGATPDGSLSALQHDVLQATSQFEDYAETIAHWSAQLYNCAHVKLDHRIARLDVNTPLAMRAPGPTTGSFALEVAMDEMAYQLNMDPVEFRLRNYTDRNLMTDTPFSSKALRECYREGAAKIGWDQRLPAPRSMRKGDLLIGLGMAGGIWDALQTPVTAQATLTLDGKLMLANGVNGDIGCGTSTVMAQIAADVLGSVDN